ncbi:hypothetical protein Q604_UNBC14120G0002, partial [human gut metagenome]
QSLQGLFIEVHLDFISFNEFFSGCNAIRFVIYENPFTVLFKGRINNTLKEEIFPIL